MKLTQLDLLANCNTIFTSKADNSNVLTLIIILCVIFYVHVESPDDAVLYENSTMGVKSLFKIQQPSLLCIISDLLMSTTTGHHITNTNPWTKFLMVPFLLAYNI